MAITNASLAQQVSDLLLAWRNREYEFQAWMTGAVDGGDYANGTFPLTDYIGTVRYTKSPARLEADVTGLVDSASTYADAASASAGAAAASAATASGHVTSANSAQTAAEAARDLASSYKDLAASSEANALTYSSNALTSANNAALSEANASTSETNAAASAAAALASEIAAAASAAAAATFDPAGYAALADNETITGTWNFVAAPTIGGVAISLTGHTHSYLPLAGGTLTGDVYIGGGKLAYNTETFVYDGDSIPQYGMVYYDDSVFGGVSGGLSGYYGLSFFTGSAQRLAITNSGTVHPGGDLTQNLGSLSKRWLNLYAETVVSDGPGNALYFHARDGGGGNFAWYSPDGTEAKLYRNGVGDVLTMSWTGALYALGSVQAPKFYAVTGRHDGYLNASLDAMIQGQGAPILGDGIWQDHIAFKARSNCEYLPSGGSWTARTDTYDAVFDGRLGAGYNANYAIPSTEDGVRWTWTSVGYVFVDSIIVMGSTAGNTIIIKAENSSDGVVWNEMRTSNAASSWPGAHVFYVQGNTSAGQAYYRITITRTHENANNVEIGHIRSVGIYGGGQRLFDWNYNRKLTFANRIEVAGSGYELNPTGVVLGQYTATEGYIQAPGGASGSLEVWTGNVSFMQKWDNTQILINRNTLPYTDNGINFGSAAFRWANVYSAYVETTYLFNGDGTANAIQMTDSWLRLNQAGQFTSGVYTPGILRADGGLWFGSGGGTNITGGTGSSARVTNANGYVEIGPQNTSWAHFVTDRGGFYFSTAMTVNGDLTDYNGGSVRPYLHLTNTGMTTGGNVTFSTSAPSGGADGDIWFVYT